MINLLKNYLKSCYNIKEIRTGRDETVYSALEIARYIINYANSHDMIISNLKLQKILYFVQLEFLLNKKTCFEDNIEAWDFGPVIPSVYHEFKQYGAFAIPKISYVYDDSDGLFNLKKISYKPHIEECDKKIIEDVVNECNQYSAGQLVEITHNQSPWKETYVPHKNKKITIDSLKNFINSINEVKNG